MSRRVPVAPPLRSRRGSGREAAERVEGRGHVAVATRPARVRRRDWGSGPRSPATAAESEPRVRGRHGVGPALRC